jgi:hypothetical protein
MICAVKDGAWLIQALSIAGLDQQGTFGALGSDADKGSSPGRATLDQKLSTPPNFLRNGPEGDSRRPTRS